MFLPAFKYLNLLTLAVGIATLLVNVLGLPFEPLIFWPSLITGMFFWNMLLIKLGEKPCTHSCRQ